MNDLNVKIKSIDDGDIRNQFQRDRDRILYSKPFRRLSGKTQVFYARTDDHIRNRLTHTLEVNQIANTLAYHLPKMLEDYDINLDLSLTEAIALGHDIGHTPFGHAGEKILNSITNGMEENILKKVNLDKTEIRSEEKGFKHNLQGIRIFKELTKQHNGEKGLNISSYTLWGIMNHTGYDLGEHSFYKKYIEENQESNYLSIEALIVREADEIAQRHHDIEDTIDLDLVEDNKITKKVEGIFGEDINNKNLLKELWSNLKSKRNLSKSFRLGILSKTIVDIYVDNYLKAFKSMIKKLESKEKIFEFLFKDKSDILCFNKPFDEKDEKFKDDLKNIVLNSQSAQMMDGKGNFIIRKLFEAYLTNPQQLPDNTIHHLFSNLDHFDKSENNELRIKLSKIHKEIKKNNINENILDGLNKNYREYKVILIRTITDFISNMTDEFAMKQYNDLYGITY
jgi:dGTPase